MNTESPEYKNVRELVAKHLWYYNTRSRLTWDGATDKRKSFWRDKAKQILLIKGILIEADDQKLPLTNMEKYLDENHCLTFNDDGTRERHIEPYYPKPTEEYPVTKVHIRGEYVASRLSHELETQKDMLNAGFRRVV